jgi:hypothetical protein
MIENEFQTKIGEFPDLIKDACHFARALRNPDKMKTQEDLRKGLGLLVTTVGGLSIVMGILTMTASVGIWTAICIFFAGAHVPILGPIAIGAGLAVVLAGVYAAIAVQTPQILSAKAHDLLIEAISSWADKKTAENRDQAARKELKNKNPHSETEANKASIFWRIISWPYRSARDYIDGPAENCSRTKSGSTEDGK